MACDQGVLCSFYITTAYHCTSTVCDGSYLVYFCHYRCILVYSVTLRALFQSTYWPENVTSSDDLRCRSGNHTPCAVPPHAQSHLPWPRVHANNFSHTNPLPRRNTNRVMKQACTFLKYRLNVRDCSSLNLMMHFSHLVLLGRCNHDIQMLYKIAYDYYLLFWTLLLAAQ